MSHLWAKNADGRWTDHPVDSELVQLAPNGPIPRVARALLNGVSDPVLVRSHDPFGLARWLVLCSPRSRIRVNGVPLLIGARVLCDRDAIALGDGNTVFFSCEQVARIVPFPGDDNRTCCIRCKLPLEPGTPAVRCPAPGCGFWHHQSEDQPCWSYSDGCAGCGHPTAFDAGFQWSPSEL